MHTEYNQEQKNITTKRDKCRNPIKDCIFHIGFCPAETGLGQFNISGHYTQLQHVLGEEGAHRPISASSHSTMDIELRVYFKLRQAENR